MRHPLLALVLALLASSAQAQEAAKLASEPVPVGTRLLDLDGDGALDLLELRADGGLSVRRNVGPRSFVEVRQELPAVRVSDVLLSDLDGDGRLDLYLVGPEADVALVGLGGGAFRAATQELGLGESGHGLSAERRDVDADGLQDLVVHNQGSDVLFWARADGRFEREELTQDGVAPTAATVIAVPLPDSPGVAQGADQDSSGPGRTLGAPATSSRESASSTSAPGSASARFAAPPPLPSSAPLIALSLDARFVNDNQNEVDSADIVDGSLTGADVSTSSGNVTIGGGASVIAASVIAAKGVFGFGANASTSTSTVSGGDGNTAGNFYSTVSGGNINTASGDSSTVSGGAFNSASGYYSTVSGGRINSATSYFSTVSGGTFNGASGYYSTVSGGYSNSASGHFSTVSGGSTNTASGNHSFAAGRRAKANHNGSFVWGDSVSVDKTSSAADQFNVYAEGGARVFAVGQTTPSMVVDPAGNVGIGTASPAQPLDVLGSMQVDGSTLFVDSTNDLVGIGTTAPVFTLEVNGTAGKPGGGDWSVSSDRRLKKNIRDLEGSLETLLALRGVSFEYKDPAAIHELAGERIGFIAQEVEEILPDWVEEIDGYKRLTIRGFEALAVEALRELREENAALEARVAELEVLESELAQLRATLVGNR